MNNDKFNLLQTEQEYDQSIREKTQIFFGLNPKFTRYSGGSFTSMAYTLKVDLEEAHESPLEDLEDVGFCLALTRNYRSSGEELPVDPLYLFNHQQRDGPSSLNIARFENNYYWLPIYIHDHSVVSFNTVGFNCNWDSGQAGWVFIKKSDFVKAGFFGIKKSHPAKLKQQWAETWLRGIVANYNDYASGNNFGWSIEDAKGEIVDSCSGYLGEAGLTSAIFEGLARLKGLQKADLLKRVLTLRALIRNRVPLKYRPNLLKNA